MIMQWLQKHRISLLFLLLIVSAGGIYTTFQLPVMLFPSIQFPRIVVSVDSGDRPVDRMVTEITQPMEQALRSVPGVVDVRSTSSRGTAEFSVNFNWNTDMIIALLQVQAAINQILPTMPKETNFNAKRMDPIVYPIQGLSLTSKTRDLVSLRDFAYFQLRPLLTVVPGVASVDLAGGERAEYQILLDPEKLQAANIALNDIVNALVSNNIITAIGRVEDYYRLYLILGDTGYKTLADLKSTIIRTSEDGIIDLSDIAKIVKGNVPEWTRVTANGHEAVLVNILQQPDGNTVAIIDSINKQLQLFKDHIPKDIQIQTWYDQSQLVNSAAHNVQDAILIGAILAVFVLAVFLRNIKMTIIIAVILPCVLATTVLLLYVLKMSFNIMTLGGMAAAVGLIVDDGVVMLEHIMRRLNEKSTAAPSHGLVLKASLEMFNPLAGSSAATIIIFLPLVFISGITGEFFKALATTMAAALIISFIFTLVAIPLLGELLLKKGEVHEVETEGPMLRKMQNHYHSLMIFLFQRPVYFILSIIMVLVIGYFSFLQIGSGFMPNMDEGGFILDYLAPPGTSLTETNRLLNQVEKILIEIPEVSNYSRRTGLQSGGSLTEANSGDFFIRLIPPPRADIHLIMAKIRNKILEQVPGLTVETSQLMEDMIGDLTAVPQPIELKIFGDNQSVLQQLAPKLADELSTVPGVVEIKNGIIISGDAIDIQIDRVKAALLNLDPQSVTSQIQTLIMGNVVTQIQEGEKIIGVRVWSKASVRERLSALDNMQIRGADGHMISLRNIAKVTVVKGQAEITRENLKPIIAITARIEGSDMGTTMNLIHKKFDKMPLPVGVYIQYGGLYQEQQKSIHQMMIVFSCAILLVASLLLFLYENYAIVLSILSMTVFALIGVLVGLWLTGTEINISSMMGMTMIVGMVTELAIFYFSELRNHSEKNLEALLQAGMARMRPILMTSMIAILALLPLAIGLGMGSDMQKPLAISIIFGLIFSMPAVLILMPLIYLWLIKRARVFRWREK